MSKMSTPTPHNSPSSRPLARPHISLGLDPGTRKIGYGVVRREKGVLSAVDYGAIRLPTTPSTRHLALSNEVRRLLARYRPDAVAIEALFTHRNMKTALALSEHRGVMVAVCALVTTTNFCVPSTLLSLWERRRSELVSAGASNP